VNLSNHGLANLILLSCVLPLSRSRTDVLRGATALAKNEALRFAPPPRHSKSLPHVGPSTFHEIESVRIARKGELEGVIGVITVAIAIRPPGSAMPGCYGAVWDVLSSAKLLLIR
jgi:hypothetical protein